MTYRENGTVRIICYFIKGRRCEDLAVKDVIDGFQENAKENPEYNYSLPVYQTACGAFDIFNHVLDNYYLAGDATFDMALNSILDVGTVHGLSNIPFCSFKKRYGCFPVSISLFVVKVNGTGKMYS